MLDKVFLGQRVSKLDIGEASPEITRVNLFVDSNNMYTAGDDTGKTIEKTCPWGTQEMCNSILARVSKVKYQPFSGESGLIDPAAETGDGITVGGVYSVLADSTIRFNGLYNANISAPGGNEVEDEYPYKSRSQRQYENQLAKTYSRITKTADRITLEVNNQIDGLNSKLELTASSLTAEINDVNNGLNSKIELTASSLTSQINNVNSGLSSRIEQTASSLTSEIQGTNNRVSSIKQYVDGITLSVSNGPTSSSITLKSGSATISSQTIEMNGLVTFTGLQNGTTIINGDCIKTGLIAAERLNLTGAITFGDLDWNTQGTINNASSTAYNALDIANNAAASADDANYQVSQWQYPGTTYIDGSRIMTGTVMASQLLGGYVGLLDSSERNVGGISITYTSTGYGIELSSNTGGIRINASGNFWVDSHYGTLGITTSGVVCGADCVPVGPGRYSLGSGGLNWTDVYADNGTIITSDKNKKTDISYDLSAYDLLFKSLKPATYRLINGSSGRIHVGMIAQDVEKSLSETGISAENFAGFIKSQKVDSEGNAISGEYEYALRYCEFISMCIRQIQLLINRVDALEGK